MHEASLVLAMCEEIKRLAQKERARKVLSIVVTFGEFSGIEEEAFRFAFEALKKGLPLFEGARLFIEKVPAHFRCPWCGRSYRPLEGPNCPSCQVPGLPAGGGELEIKKVEFLLEEENV